MGEAEEAVFLFTRCSAFTQHLQHTRDSTGETQIKEKASIPARSSQCRAVARQEVDREICGNSTVMGLEVARQGLKLCQGWGLRSFVEVGPFDLGLEGWLRVHQ